MDRDAGRQERAPRQKRDVKENEEMYREAVEDSMRWLEESRAALLELGFADGKVPEEQSEWKKEAVRRWGHRVEALHFDDWSIYVQSRMSTPPPASPHDLLQEYYAHDVWQLLCTCALMSRVSSWDTKHNTISSFFEKYPTPSHLLDANPERVLDCIKPLGLFPTRMQSLVSISTRILEMPQFILGLNKEHKVYGIGEFGFQSYQIFCQNKGTLISPTDRALATFANWQKKQAKNKAAGGGQDEEEEEEEEEEEKEEEEEEEEEEKLSNRAQRMAQRGVPAPLKEVGGQKNKADEKQKKRKKEERGANKKEEEKGEKQAAVKEPPPKKQQQKEAAATKKSSKAQAEALSSPSPKKKAKKETTATKQLGIQGFFTKSS